MRHDWPAKKTFIDLPIKMKGNSKRTSGNSLSQLGAQNKDIGAASQTLLTEVKLHLRRRLSEWVFSFFFTVINFSLFYLLFSFYYLLNFYNIQLASLAGNRCP